jgi:hypothetical protein
MVGCEVDRSGRWRRRRRPSTPPVSMVNYVLEILDGDRAGEVLPVVANTVRVGRKPGNDVVLADEKTSGVHAEIVPEGDRHVLRDLGSTNGTFLDGKRVTELVLTPGDVVTFGRLRVKFRREGDAADGIADAGDLAVRRLDANRVPKKGGALAVGLIALLAAGGGGYFWWQSRGAVASDGEPQARNRREPLAVAGDLLPKPAAGCENGDGWNLQAAGVGFQASGPGHTGSGTLLARRGEGSGDFAIAQLAEPLALLSGRTLTIAAHARTNGGGQVAVRGVAFASNEAVPFRFRTGTALATAEGWQRLTTVLTLPAGCDRLQVELVAVLPSADSEVAVDDVAVTEGGEPATGEWKLPETNQTALATGAAFAVRSVDVDNPAILLALAPGTVPASLQALHQAGLCTLSDVGASVACTPSERGFQIVVKHGGSGASGLQLVFPADAAGGLFADAGDASAAGEGGFAPLAAVGTFDARAVLLGDRLTRALVQVETKVGWVGQQGGGRYLLTLPGDRFDLVVGFRAERQQAAELVRQAKKAQQDGQPGQALDRLRDLVRTVPMDSEGLGQALQLRGELLAAQGERFAQLTRDFDEASFFTTRGGFERVAQGVDDLVAAFGRHNLEGAAAIDALRAEAGGKLAAIDGQDREAERARLTELAAAFQAADQGNLAALVQAYMQKHLAGKQDGGDR